MKNRRRLNWERNELCCLLFVSSALISSCPVGAVLCSPLTCSCWCPTSTSPSLCLKLLIIFPKNRFPSLFHCCCHHSQSHGSSNSGVSCDFSFSPTCSTFCRPSFFPSPLLQSLLEPWLLSPHLVIAIVSQLVFPHITAFLLESILQFTTRLSSLRWGFAFVTPSTSPSVTPFQRWSPDSLACFSKSWMVWFLLLS